MEAKQFILQKMSDLVTLFPKVRVRYDFHFLSKTHALEIVPNKVYDFDQSYKSWESDALFEFMDLFPEESITFVSDNSILGIDKVDYELVGDMFAEQPCVCKYKTRVNLMGYDLLGDTLKEAFEALFDNFSPMATGKLDLEQKLKATNPLAIPSDYTRIKIALNTFHASVGCIKGEVDTLIAKDASTVYKNSENVKFASAA